MAQSTCRVNTASKVPGCHGGNDASPTATSGAPSAAATVSPGPGPPCAARGPGPTPGDQHEPSAPSASRCHNPDHRHAPAQAAATAEATRPRRRARPGLAAHGLAPRRTPPPRHEVCTVRGRPDRSASVVTQLVTRAGPVARLRTHPERTRFAAWSSGGSCSYSALGRS